VVDKVKETTERSIGYRSKETHTATTEKAALVQDIGNRLLGNLAILFGSSIPSEDLEREGSSTWESRFTGDRERIPH
jgi:hypothetical protein